MKKVLLIAIVVLISTLSFVSVYADIDPIDNGVTILIKPDSKYTSIKCESGDIVVDVGENDTIIVRCNNSNINTIYLPHISNN